MDSFPRSWRENDISDIGDIRKCQCSSDCRISLERRGELPAFNPSYAIRLRNHGRRVQVWRTAISTYESEEKEKGNNSVVHCGCHARVWLVACIDLRSRLQDSEGE